MKLLTINIRHGGGTRDDALLDFVRGENADVVVLTEFRRNATGNRLAVGLAQLGLAHLLDVAAEP